MAERTFKHFPDSAICPICETNDDKETCLIPIDGTTDGNICEAVPVHVECMKEIGMYRYNKENGLIYRKL